MIRHKQFHCDWILFRTHWISSHFIRIYLANLIWCEQYIHQNGHFEKKTKNKTKKYLTSKQCVIIISHHTIPIMSVFCSLVFSFKLFIYSTFDDKWIWIANLHILSQTIKMKMLIMFCIYISICSRRHFPWAICVYRKWQMC